MVESFLKDFDELLDIRLNKLTELEPDLDIREGSIAHDLAGAGAIADGQLLFSMDIFKNLLFAQTSTGEYLDRRTAEIGIRRNQGARARGTLQVSGMVSTTIPVGTQFADSRNTLIFESTEEVITSPEGTGTVPIQATETGDRYNVGPNSIVQPLGDFLGVLEVNNPQGLTGGINMETDEALLARYQDKLSNPPVSGNASQLRQWAMEINGIGGARVERRWNGNGTVRIITMDANKRTPSAELLEQVENYLNDEDRIPIGAEITVAGAVEVPIHVTAKVELRPGYPINFAMEEYAGFMREFIEDMAMQTDILQYVRFNFLFMNMKSVFNFRDMKVNGGTEDIELGSNEIPVMGSVVFTL